MARSSSSKRWLKEHASDRYVQQAKRAGYRARSAYKLLEIQQKYKLLKPGMAVIDLGAAPGGWTQVLQKVVTSRGAVYALDRLPIASIPHVEIIQGDFTQQDVATALTEKLAGRLVNMVLSDMAPDLCGIAAVDQPRSFYLAELALDFATHHLRQGGHFLVKVFQGAGHAEFIKELRQHFKQVRTCKPSASRDRSREIYLLAVDFQP